MKKSTPDWFETCVTRLTSEGSLRVWSVLVTIFGDLAQDESDQVSGALITGLTGLAGIKAEATRVALHRLRKEGWIESTRVGRNSMHRLTQFGRQQSAEAAPRIYARETKSRDVWHVLIAGSSETSRSELAALTLTGDYISVNSTVAMSPGAVPGGLEGLLGVESSTLYVPSWLRELCGPEALQTAYDQFWDSVQVITRHLPPEGTGDPMKTAILRVLVVHNWRRIVLRHPDLPMEFLPEGWNGHACREAVFRLLERLPRPDLEILEAGLGA
ncbi:MAG: PaaX family transcriptional regulator C-terminal domain-containing protein [Ruegeria sp.]